MSDYDELTDEQLSAIEMAGVAWCSEATFASLIAELRALRKLRAEVEPVLEHCESDPNFCEDCETKARDILARHFGKEKGE